MAWAKENQVWVVSDLAYSELYFDGKPTPSIMQVPGAKDVAIEFTSMSKTYSMAGWRMGFAVGNKQLIAALTRVKSYLDYGAFTPIQAAACAALNGPQDIIESNRELYGKRRDVMVESFRPCRVGYPPPLAPRMFAWAPLPPALKSMGQPGILQAIAHPGRRSRWRRAWAMARTARAMSGSPWSRTSSACGRPRATSGVTFSRSESTVRRLELQTCFKSGAFVCTDWVILAG